MDILIRKAKAGDGKKWIEFWNEGIKRKFFIYTGNNELRSKKDAIKSNRRYKFDSKNNFTFFAIDKNRNKLVGVCGAHGSEMGRLRHKVYLGWCVLPDYAGKGIGKLLVEAIIKEAKKRKIKRIEAEIALKNIPSLRLAKRMGFKVEGRKKAGMLLDNGKFMDMILVGKVLK